MESSFGTEYDGFEQNIDFGTFGSHLSSNQTSFDADEDDFTNDSCLSLIKLS